jgi:hypothetical protein
MITLEARRTTSQYLELSGVVFDGPLRVYLQTQEAHLLSMRRRCWYSERVEGPVVTCPQMVPADGKHRAMARQSVNRQTHTT